MGGKSAPPPQQASEPAPAESSIAPPTPIPDRNAIPGQTHYGAYTSYGEQLAAEEEDKKKEGGLGTTGTERERRRQRDPAALVNEGGSLGTSAVLTG